MSPYLAGFCIMLCILILIASLEDYLASTQLPILGKILH
jgi:hypothetical protein